MEKHEIVKTRNELAHGFMEPNADDTKAYKEGAQRLEEDLTEIEEVMAPFFEQLRLIIPLKIDLKDRTFVATGHDLSGSHLIHPQFEAKCTTNPITLGLESMGEIFLSDSNWQKFHCISPYIKREICPECEHQRVLITDGGNSYLDVFMGHQVDL